MVDRRKPVSRFSDIVISIILSEAGALQLAGRQPAPG